MKKTPARIIIFLLCLACCVVSSITTLYFATRPTNKIVLSDGGHTYSDGVYCALIVQQDRDWRALPFNPFAPETRDNYHWRFSVFVGKDCNIRQDLGVWTDFPKEWGDSKSKVSGAFTDQGYTFTLSDGRSLFIPASLYLQTK